MTTLRYSEWKNRQRGSGTRLLSKLFRRGRRAGTISPEEERDVILNRPGVVVVGETELRVKCPPMRRWYAIMEDVFAKLDEAKDNKEAIVKILSVTSRLESPDAEFIRSIIPYASWTAGILGAVIGREGEWIEDEATPAQMFDLLLVCTEILDIEAIVGKNLAKWQTEGLVPDMEIESGYNTDQPIRERGWTFWHHLFTPQQLLFFSILRDTINSASEAAIMILRIEDHLTHL